ncbi:MAG: hypothetical protein ACETWQ_03025 [Phycisphaerae bacterium]
MYDISNTIYKHSKIVLLYYNSRIRTNYFSPAIVPQSYRTQEPALLALRSLGEGGSFVEWVEGAGIYSVVISTEAPVFAFTPVPALPPFLLSQESTRVQARKHGGVVEKSGKRY